MNILSVVIAFFAATFTHNLLQDGLFTSYGAFVPWRRFQHKHILIVPLALTAISTLALLYPDNPMVLAALHPIAPRLFLGSLVLSLVMVSYRCTKAPHVDDITLDTAMHRRYPGIKRISPSAFGLEDNEILRDGDTYLGVQMIDAWVLLLEHLRATGHTVTECASYNAGTWHDGDQFMHLTAESVQDKGVSAMHWTHQVVYETSTGLLTIHSNVNV